MVGLLRNGKTGRWHPACFDTSQSPGETRGVTYWSTGHHTRGFTNRGEALSAARHVAETLVGTGCASECLLALAKDIEWDGENPPAMVESVGELKS